MLHLNGLLHGTGELRVGGEDARTADLRARVGLVFQDPDDQLFMPSVCEDVAFGPLNLGAAPEEALVRAAPRWRAVRMGELGGAGAAPALARAAAPRRDRRRAGHGARSARARRAVGEPGSADAPRAARAARRHGADDARRHARPAVRRPAVRARGGALRRAASSADGPCLDVLEDADLLAAHDLELPAGLRPARASRARRPACGVTRARAGCSTPSSSSTPTTARRRSSRRLGVVRRGDRRDQRVEAVLLVAGVERGEGVAQLLVVFQPQAGGEALGGERARELREDRERVLALAALVQDPREREAGVGAAGLELQRAAQVGLAARPRRARRPRRGAASRRSGRPPRAAARR